MASTYLSRTQSTGNKQTFTISAWIKRSSVANPSQSIISAGSGGEKDFIHFENGNLKFERYNGGFVFQLITNRVFRDTSGWYHVVITYDSPQATASDRIKMYINGVQETSFATANYPSQNYNSIFNNSSFTNYISKESDANNYFDGQMAHVHLIDGTAYSASTFGETDATTGIWKPKTAPSVTYGTNGFFLKFENSGSMGTDSSGNSNNFTVNGTMTQTIDTPSNVFATLNPLIASSIPTYSNGNLTIAGASTWESSPSTLAVSSGKYYAEFKDVSGTNNMVGVENAEIQSWIVQFPGWSSDGWGYARDGGKRNSGIDTSYGSSFTSGDIISIALDMDNKYVYFAKNGVWQNSGDPTSGATGTGGLSLSADLYYFVTASFNSSSSANFGNGYFGTTAVSSAENPDDGIGIFEYAVPTGYKALCTKSINAQEYD